MSLPKININQNGTHKAPPDSGGAFAVDGTDANIEAMQRGLGKQNSERTASPLTHQERISRVVAQRTVFPVDEPSPSLRTLLYRLSRYYVAGAPLFRWLIIGLIAIGLLWIALQAPGGWLGSLPWGIAVLALLHIRRQWRSYGYVHFETAPPPTVEPMRLPADAKLPVHATGHFSVEGKEQYDTWLPGFYRTFATREHALLCQVADKRLWKFGRRPPDEVGMWYIFFMPSTIEGVRWGQLYFGAKPQLAIAVDYKVEIQSQGRFRNQKIKTITVFIATQNEGDARAIMADLLYDL